MRRARAARSPRAGRRPWARPRAPDGSPTPPSSPGAHRAPSRASRPPIRLQPRFSSRGLGGATKTAAHPNGAANLDLRLVPSVELTALAVPRPPLEPTSPLYSGWQAFQVADIPLAL